MSEINVHDAAEIILAHHKLTGEFAALFDEEDGEHDSWERLANEPNAHLALGAALRAYGEGYEHFPAEVILDVVRSASRSYTYQDERLQTLQKKCALLEVAVLLSSACISKHFGETFIGILHEVDLACAAIEATDGMRNIKLSEAIEAGEALLAKKAEAV